MKTIEFMRIGFNINEIAKYLFSHRKVVLLFHIFLLHLFTTTISNYSALSLILKAITAALLLFILFWCGSFSKPFYISINKSNNIYIGLLFLFVLPLLSLLYTHNLTFGAIKLVHLYVSLPPAIMAVYYFLKQERRTLNYLCNIVIIYASIFSVLIIILNPFIHATSYSFSIERWSHVLSGRFLGVALVIVFSLLASREKWGTILTLACSAIIIFYAIYVSSLRASIVALSISLPILFYFLIRKSGKKKAYLLLIIIITSTFVAFLLTPESSIPQKRMVSFYNSLINGHFEDGAILARIESTKISLQIFSENPLLGIGFGGFNGYDNLEITKMMKYPHNLLLEYAVEMGSVGLGIFIYFVIIILRKTHKIHLMLLLIFTVTFVLSMFSKDIPSNTLFMSLFAVILYRHVKMH